MNLSLEEIRLVNEELLQMVRSGLPIASSLELLPQSTHRVNRYLQQLSQRLQAGDDLAAAVRSANEPVSDIYASLIEAGVRSHRLPEMLTEFAKLLDDLQEVRQRITSLFAYPFVSFLLGWTIFLLLVGPIAEMLGSRWAAALGDLVGNHRWMIAISQSVKYWGWIGYAVLGLLMISWALASGTRSLVNPKLRWLFPFLTGHVNASWKGYQLQLLARLIDAGLPYVDALRLIEPFSPSHAVRLAIESARVQVDPSVSDPSEITLTKQATLKGDESLLQLLLCEPSADVFRHEAVTMQAVHASQLELRLLAVPYVLLALLAVVVGVTIYVLIVLPLADLTRALAQ